MGIENPWKMEEIFIPEDFIKIKPGIREFQFFYGGEAVIGIASIFWELKVSAIISRNRS